MLQFSEFVWALSYSVWDVFNNFSLIDATDRSKISSDQKRFFIALNLYPLSFFANTPFKRQNTQIRIIESFQWFSDFPNQNLRRIGPWVYELWSDIETNRETNRKQKILLYIYKLALPGDYSWKFRIFTPRWEHYFHRVPESEYQENRSMDSWVMIGHSNRQTDNRDN